MPRHLPRPFRRFFKAIAGLQRYVMRPWYVALVALLAGLDLFLLVFPTDVLLVAGVLAKPRRWPFAGVAIALGSSLGALAMCVLLRYDKALVHRLFPNLFHTEGWHGTVAFLRDHGFWALAAIALSPLPQQPAVLVAALSPMPLMEAFFGVLLGRTTKYLLLAWLASYAPNLFRRWFKIGEPEKKPD